MALLIISHKFHQKRKMIWLGISPSKITVLDLSLFEFIII
jgi:hypothetical protein